MDAGYHARGFIKDLSTYQGEVLETDTGAVFYRTKSKETLTTISDSLRAHYGKNVFSYPKMQQRNNMLYSDIMDWAYAIYEGTTRSFKLREWSTKTCYWNTHLPSGFILHVAAKSSTSSDHTQSLLRLACTRLQRSVSVVPRYDCAFRA